MRNPQSPALVLALCRPAFAGDIPRPIVAPTPQPARAVQEMTLGVVTLPPRTPDSYAQDGALAAALTFFEVVPNLLSLS
jgi:hypothetical protein